MFFHICNHESHSFARNWYRASPSHSPGANGSAYTCSEWRRRPKVLLSAVPGKKAVVAFFFERQQVFAKHFHKKDGVGKDGAFEVRSNHDSTFASFDRISYVIERMGDGRLHTKMQ